MAVRAFRRGILRQLWRFGLIGVASTAVYSLLFWVLRPLVPGVAANTLALVATAIANTAANRRFTFGVRGSEGLAGDQLSGLIALALALATTNVSMAALQAARLAPPRSIELAVLIAANGIATLVRFALLRVLIQERHPEHHKGRI